MSDLPPCLCGGWPDERGGLVSHYYWVTCRVCGAKTGGHDTSMASRQAWRERRIQARAALAAIVEPGT